MSDTDLFETQTPSLSTGFGSQERTDPEPVWGKLFSTCIYLPSLDLSKSSITWGRSLDSDIILNSSNFSRGSLKTISKNHFEIMFDEIKDTVMISDLSKNGTFVNGTLIGKRNKLMLQHNDVIAIGAKGQEVYIFKKIENQDRYYLPIELRMMYDVGKVLGKGSCGEVRLAYEKSTCKEYAIKKIIKSKVSFPNNLTSKQRIETEVNIMQSLSHPCIISTKEVVETTDETFIVMDYMNGGELTDLITNFNEPLSESKVKLLFYQMVLAVRHLHLRDITHRDLKPGNVLLSSSSPDSLVKISDFGLSKIMDVTYMTTVCGTPYFVAPEIINANCSMYTQQIDVWSLGVILFYMLSKELPFFVKNGSNRDIFKCIISGNYSMNSLFWERVSREAKDLISKMLICNPEERLTIHDVFNHPWIAKDNSMQYKAKQIMYQDLEINPPAPKRPRFVCELDDDDNDL